MLGASSVCLSSRRGFVKKSSKKFILETNKKVAVPRKLWFTIASAPVVLFRAEVMLDVVECWHWLLSACPTQELVFLQVRPAHSSCQIAGSVWHKNMERIC